MLRKMSHGLERCFSEGEQKLISWPTLNGRLQFYATELKRADKAFSSNKDGSTKHHAS